MNETIEVGEINTYVPRKTIGGWYLIYINDDRSGRSVDGGHIYPSRQNAYRRAKELNDLQLATQGLIEVGSGWWSGPHKTGGKYHVHPNKYEPRQEDILAFKTPKEILAWIEHHKLWLADQARQRVEAYEGLDEERYN